MKTVINLPRPLYFQPMLLQGHDGIQPPLFLNDTISYGLAARRSRSLREHQNLVSRTSSNLCMY